MGINLGFATDLVCDDLGHHVTSLSACVPPSPILCDVYLCMFWGSGTASYCLFLH